MENTQNKLTSTNRRFVHLVYCILYLFKMHIILYFKDRITILLHVIKCNQHQFTWGTQMYTKYPVN